MDHITGELFHLQKLQLMKQRLQVAKGLWLRIEVLVWFHLGHKANKGHSTNPLGDESKACWREKKRWKKVDTCKKYDIFSLKIIPFG